jgi:WD40 repeat protein
VLLWNLHPRAKPQRLEAGRTVLSVAFSPDGTTLAAGTDDGAILLWNLPAGTQLPQLLQTRLGQVYSVAFSPEGNTLAAGTYAGSVLLRDMTTGTQLGVLRGGIRNAVGGDPNQVHSVAFSPDGKTLAAGTEDGTVQLWNRVSSSGLEEQACSLVVNNLSKEDWDALAPGLKYVARVC